MKVYAVADQVIYLWKRVYNVKCEEYFNKKIISIWTNRKISRSVKEGDSLRSEEFVNKDKN